MNAVVDDRPGNTESSGANFFAAQMWFSLAGKFLDDQIELGETFTGEALAEDHFQLAVLFREERQIAFGTTHVACENHLTSRAKRNIKPF